MKRVLPGLRLALLVGIGLLARQQHGVEEPPRRPREADLDALAGIGQAILSVQLRLNALCELVYEQASRLIDTRNFQLGLFDADDYVIMVWLRDGQRLPGERFHDTANEGLIGWVRRTGESLLVGDYEAEWDTLPAKPRHYAQRPARAGLFTPLIAGGETIGVIVVQSDTPHAFHQDDLRLLKVLTNQAAGAIRNAQLFEQAQARHRQMQLVNEVSRQLTALQPLADLFRQIVTLIHDTFGYYAVNIFILDEKAGELHLKASSHPTYESDAIRLSSEEGLIGWAAANAQTALAPDVTQDERYRHSISLDETRAEVATPLMVEQRVVGVLDVQSDQAGAFSHDDVTTLETLAGQIALAIQEAETYDAERRQRERLDTLVEASRAVVSILDINALLDEVIDLATDHFGYDRTHIFLREGERVVFRAGSGVHSGRWVIERLAYQLEDRGLIAQTVRTGQPLLSPDVLADPRYVPGPGLEDTRSEMVIPIRIGQHVLGALDVQSTELNAFSPEDAEMAQALCDTIAVALRNATLYTREQRRRILAETLREANTVLGASLEIDSVLGGMLHGLERVITVNAAVILLYDDEQDAYRISAVRGQLPDPSLLGRLIPAEADIATVLTTLFHPQERDTTPHQHDHLFIPLIIGDEPIGYLGIDHQRGERFSADDLEIINAFATQAAIAIANAHLYMAQREEAWISTALLQVAEATTRAESLEDVLQMVARITPLLVGVEWCAVLLIERGDFRIVEIEGGDPDVVKSLVGLTVRPDLWPPLADLIENGEPVVLEAQSVPVPGNDNAVWIGQGFLLPLFARGEIVGALAVGQQGEAEPLSARKIELLGGITNQAAVAIEGAQLQIAQQEEAWVTTALLQVAQAVNAQVELAETLETVVRLTPLLVGVSRCGVLRWDEAARLFYGGVAHGLSPAAEQAFAQMSMVANEYPYLERLADSTAPLACGAGTEHELPPPMAPLFEASALVGLPLIAQGRLVGIMLVDHAMPDITQDPRRMNILTGIASQTALAVETSRLQDTAAERRRLERELELARDIQSSFLPDSAPAVPGWEVAAYYRSARLVGGDFYDFIPLRDGAWGLVVADVADKGVPAALFMALSRTLIRAVARNRDDPAEALARVNQLLLADTRADLFVTVWYGIWNPADASLRYSSAGHNPPFIVRCGAEKIDSLALKGIALGVLEDITLRTGETRLEPGDVLVLYTDGVTEARDAGDIEFGLGRLEQAARDCCRCPASEIAAGIITALDDHTGDEPPFDDLTLAIVRRD